MDRGPWTLDHEPALPMPAPLLTHLGFLAPKAEHRLLPGPLLNKAMTSGNDFFTAVAFSSANKELPSTAMSPHAALSAIAWSHCRCSLFRPRKNVTSTIHLAVMNRRWPDVILMDEDRHGIGWQQVLERHHVTQPTQVKAEAMVDNATCESCFQLGHHFQGYNPELHELSIRQARHTTKQWAWIRAKTADNLLHCVPPSPLGA